MNDRREEVFANIRDVTPAYLSKLIDTLKEGEEIKLGRTEEGRVRIRVGFTNSKGKVQNLVLKNSLFTHPNMELTTPGWLPRTQVDEGWKNWVSKRTKKSRPKNVPSPEKLKEVLKASFTMEILSNPNTGVLTKRDGRDYMVYSLGEFEVYSSGKIPLMYKRLGKTEMLFL